MAPKPSCSLFRPFRGILGVLRAGTDSGAKGILKAPRVLLVVVFPIVSIILYLTLSLGCANTTLSAVSPVIVTSNGSLSIGGVATRLDIRIGFWGLCFGPEPYSCASSFTISNSRSVAELTRLIPQAKGGANPQLLRLALTLQASLIVLSGIALLVILIADLLANAIEIYFNVVGVREEHMRAAVWARALDWAAAAGAVVAFTTYKSNIDNTQKLLQTATGSNLVITPGMVASSMFAAIVGTTVAGAVINTILTSSDAGRYAYRASNGDDDSADEGVGGLGKFKDDMMRRRAAYEAFP